MFKFALIKSNPSWLVDNDGNFTGYGSESIISKHHTIEAAEKAQEKSYKTPGMYGCKIVTL